MKCELCKGEFRRLHDQRCLECVDHEERIPFKGLRLIGNLRKYGRR